MSKTQYDIPLTLVIPRPMPYEKAQDRGIESTSGPEGCHILYRGTTFERERIKLAAKACGLTYGMFIRILANNATEIILRLVKEQDALRDDSSAG